MPPQALDAPLREGRLGSVLEWAIRQVTLDVLLELVSGLITPGGVRFEAAADDRFHCRGDRPVRAAESGRRPFASLDELIDQVRAVTSRTRRGPMPRQQLEEDDPQRIEVAPPVDLSRRASIRLELLGRHVAGGPADPRGPGPVLQVDRQVEIQEHRLAVVGQQDVGGLQVEVQDRPLVRRGPARWPAGNRPRGRPGRT